MMRRIMMLDETDRALVAVPLYHKNAMASAVKPVLMSGGALVSLPGFDAGEVVRAIAGHRCTYLTGVPAMFRLILNQKALLAEHDVSSLRWAACGSAMVPPDLLREFRETFHAGISEGYGLTEGGPVVFQSPRFVHVQECLEQRLALADCLEKLAGEVFGGDFTSAEEAEKFARHFEDQEQRRSPPIIGVRS